MQTTDASIIEIIANDVRSAFPKSNIIIHEYRHDMSIVCRTRWAYDEVNAYLGTRYGFIKTSYGDGIDTFYDIPDKPNTFILVVFNR